MAWSGMEVNLILFVPGSAWKLKSTQIAPIIRVKKGGEVVFYYRGKLTRTQRSIGLRPISLAYLFIISRVLLKKAHYRQLNSTT